MRITTYMRDSGLDGSGARLRERHRQWNRRRFDSAGVVLIVETHAALTVHLRRITGSRRLREATARLQSSLTRGVNAATWSIRRRLTRRAAGPALIVLEGERDGRCEPWAAVGVEAVAADRSGLGTPLCRFSGP